MLQMAVGGLLTNMAICEEEGMGLYCGPPPTDEREDPWGRHAQELAPMMASISGRANTVSVYDKHSNGEALG